MRSEYTRNLSRGQTLYKDQRFEEALGYFKKALMLKPYSHVAWNEKGNALRKLGRQEEAMDCYERAIQLDKKRSYPFPYVGIADMYRGQEQYQAAILYYDKALGIRRHPWALNGKGICLLARNQADEALELAEEAIRIRPEFLFRISSKATSSLSGLRTGRLGVVRKAFDLIRAPRPNFGRSGE